MAAGLYWIDGPWRGKVALAARPRGGDWLGEEMTRWKRQEIDSVLSLLTPDEEREMDLSAEASEAKAHGLEFSSFPIPDLQVPNSEAKLAKVLDKLNSTLSASKNVLIHCRRGIGRTGLVAACLLVRSGMSPGAAVEKVSTARGIPVPETEEQREWIDHYAAAFTK